MRKAFLFTIDALLGLLVVAAALAAVNALHQQNGLEANSFEALGRSYLEQKYVAGASITTAQFKDMTGITASESPATGVLVAKSSLIAYPGPLDGCGCTSSSCDLNATTNDSCLYGQENLTNSLKEVWVTP